MGKAPNRTVKERYMLYALEVAGFSLKEINEVFKNVGFRKVPASTYKANMRNEALLFKAHPDLMAVQAAKPLPYGKWPEWWTDTVKYMRDNP